VIADFSDLSNYLQPAMSCRYCTSMKISVKCYSGYRVDENPISIRFDSLVVKVDKIIDQWLDPDHRYFKFIGDNAATYIIRHDMNSLDWELTFYQQKGVPSG